MTHLTIETPDAQQSFDGTIWTANYRVEEQDVWFRSRTELVATDEAMIAAFMLHSLQAATPIKVENPVDQTFAENLPKISRIAQTYWGFSGPVPDVETVIETPAADRVGQFFTGGVDSFYTLKRNLNDVSSLIYVHGFDIKLDDTARFEASFAGLQTVADALGLELIIVETNLRDHPRFKALNWEITHVAALACVAHGLKKHVSTVRVASSDVEPPWGSNPELDNLWSSAAVRLINNEYDVSRFDKVREIVDWPPVHKFLKVCWQNLSLDLNCGTCEKCLRTQAALVAAGGNLRDFDTFPDADLAKELNKLSFADPKLHGQWRRILSELHDPALHNAIKRLMFRSRVKAVLRKIRHMNAKSIMRRLRRIAIRA